MPEWMIIVYGVVGICVAIWWSRRVSLSSVISYGREQGWEMLIVDSSPRLGDADESCYQVRYREKDGTLVEGVICSSGVGHRLISSTKIPRRVEKAMFDRSLPMDCRRCGNVIAEGQSTCPYCARRRDELHVS